jgi:hypothetical protein
MHASNAAPLLPAAAGVLAVYHMWFDGEPEISRDDWRRIVGISAFAGLAADWAWRRTALLRSSSGRF